jgi:hypothetical protein
VKEVSPELTRRYALLQWDVGCGDHTNIRSPAGGATNPPHLVPIKRAQKLGLSVHGEFANLIQKECSALGFCKGAHPPRNGAREGSAFVAKHLTLDELPWQRRNIDWNEGVVRSRPFMMQRSGDEFLARSALPCNQHRRLMTREPSHLSSDTAHRR